MVLLCIINKFDMPGIQKLIGINKIKCHLAFENDIKQEYTFTVPARLQSLLYNWNNNLSLLSKILMNWFIILSDCPV